MRDPLGIPLSLVVFRVRIGPSGAFVSTLVPFRDDDLTRCFGDGDEATEIGETAEDDATGIGLSETGTIAPSKEDPALPGTGIGGADDGSANCCVLGGVLGGD